MRRLSSSWSNTRYAGTTTANPVAESEYEYDGLARLTSLAHTSSTFGETHEYAYDSAGRVAEYESLRNLNVITYAYDPTGQLIGAESSNENAIDESYAHDANGNRTEVENWQSQLYGDDEVSYSIDDGNRYSEDTGYVYAYDEEGNLTQKTFVADDSYDRTVFVWDHRNRLTAVELYAGNGTSSTENDDLLRTVSYLYDAFNQLVYRNEEEEGGNTQQSVFVHDAGQVVLQFDRTDTENPGSLTAGDLSHRYLWGPAVDQLLADELVEDLYDAEDNEVLWALNDRLGSVTDMVDNSGTERLHRAFDSSFGNIVAERHYDDEGTEVGPNDPGYIDEAFAFTGRWYDKATGLQNNLNRWYDPKTGRWLSEDPIGIVAAGDANAYRYVGNGPTNETDPNGLKRHIGMWCGHGYIEIERGDGITLHWLQFGPGYFGPGTGFVITEPYPIGVPVTPWINSTPQQDAQLVSLWNDLEKDRCSGAVNSWMSPYFLNVFWNCWTPIFKFWDYGMPKPKPMPTPPGATEWVQPGPPCKLLF
jgi:RHS repeat-associated protein